MQGNFATDIADTKKGRNTVMDIEKVKKGDATTAVVWRTLPNCEFVKEMARTCQNSEITADAPPLREGTVWQSWSHSAFHLPTQSQYRVLKVASLSLSFCHKTPTSQEVCHSTACSRDLPARRH